MGSAVERGNGGDTGAGGGAVGGGDGASDPGAAGGGDVSDDGFVQPGGVGEPWGVCGDEGSVVWRGGGESGAGEEGSGGRERAEAAAARVWADGEHDVQHVGGRERSNARRGDGAARERYRE